MLCNGERSGIPLAHEWPQSMGERILIPAGRRNNNNNNNNAPTASSSSNSTSTGTNNKMIHAAAAAAAPPPATRVIDRPAQDQQAALKCPRCDSSNTKFCYYNNYSLSQPRHFCKACKRYWTRGGTLRNVPVGGGRKNKRQKTTPTTSITSGESSAADNDTKAGIINSGSVMPPQQKQTSLLPFARDHCSSIIFPEVLRQVLLRPPAMPPLQAEYSVAGSFMGSLPPTDPPLPPPSQFTTTLMPRTINSYSSIVNPFSISSTTSSSYCPYLSISEGQSTGINISMGSSWQVAPPPPPVSDPSSAYWSGWEDDMSGYVTTELKLPNSDRTDQP